MIFFFITHTITVNLIHMIIYPGKINKLWFFMLFFLPVPLEVYWEAAGFRMANIVLQAVWSMIAILYFNKQSKNIFLSIVVVSFAQVIPVVSEMPVLFLASINENIWNALYTSMLGFSIVFVINICCILLLAFLTRRMLMKLSISTINIETPRAWILSGLILISFIFLKTIVLVNALFLQGTQYYHPISFFVVGFTTLIIAGVIYLAPIVNSEIELQRVRDKLAFRDEIFLNIQSYNEGLESVYQELRQYRHDNRNILATVGGYIIQKDISGLEDYYNNFLLGLERSLDVGISRYSQLKNLKITELKGLVALKASAAQERSIEFEIDLADEVNAVNMDTLDLCRIIGVLLDNAIEAAENSKGKIVRFGVICKPDSKHFFVENSLSESETINIRRLFERGYSTKGHDRGIGLPGVKTIVDNYSNILMEVSSADGFFMFTLSISEGQV